MNYWKTRKRGTVRQVGTKFPVVEKKSLPAKIALPAPHGGKFGSKLLTAERLAKEMAEKPVTDVAYKAPAKNSPGRITFKYDGALLNNSIEIVPEKWVGTWDRFKNTVYSDPMVPKKNVKSISIHESVEKYLKERHGLSDNAEGHEAAEELEKKTFLKHGGTLKGYSLYSKIVERIHRARMAEEERAGGKAPVKIKLVFSPIKWEEKMPGWAVKAGASIVYMSPEEYLRKVPSLVDERLSASRMPDKYYVKSSLDYIKKQIERGEEVELPWVDYKRKFRGNPDHDGRHRAKVAKDMGIKLIPVMVIR